MDLGLLLGQSKLLYFLKKHSDTVETLFLCTIQEGYDLPSGTGIIRTEFACSGTLGDAICHCPVNCICIPLILSNIVKHLIHVTYGDGASGCTIQEGYDLSSGAGCIGTEFAITGTLGDVILYSPLYSLGISLSGRNIAELSR